MNIRKYMVLVVSGAVTAVVGGALVFYLFRGASAYTAVGSAIESDGRALAQLGSRKPFPSDENVALATKNLERIQAFSDATMGAFLKNQYDPPPMEPARFPQLLQRSLQAMNFAASSNGVTVTEKFFYGFDRYARGQPPAKDDIPRLSRQLHVVETLVRTLCAARIRDIAVIERHVFEDDAAAAAGGEGGVVRREDVEAKAAAATGPAAGYLQDPSGLFVRERLVLTFNAKEGAVWEALNALPRLPVFFVVSDLDIQNAAGRPVLINPADGTRKTEAGGGGGEFSAADVARAVVPGAPATPGAVVARPLTRAERNVAGITEALKVRLQVDFYTFRKPGGSGAGQEKQP